MKKIVLYNPNPQKGEIVKDVSLALLSVASLLDRGYNIKIFNHDDENVEDKILESCSEAICFGLGAMTGNQIKDGLRVCKLIREKFPKLPLVWGGWHVSILPNQSLENEYVDIVVIGQGQRTFYELVKSLDFGRNLRGINGISYKESGNIVINNPMPLENLDNFPPLPYHLIKEDKLVRNVTEINTRTIDYFSSQGCPYRCAFCADRLVYKRMHIALSAKRVVEDLKKLKNDYNINGVVFTDTNFFLNEKRIQEICKGMIKEGLNLKWGSVNGRTNNLLSLKDETWELLKKSNFHSFLIGAESAIQEELDLITKDATVEQTIDVAKKCKKYGFRAYFSFILGLPIIDSTDKKDWKKHLQREINALIDITNKILTIDKGHVFYYLIYVPYPGSPLFERAVKMGFKSSKTFEGWGEFDHNVTHLPWVPKKYANLTHQFTILFLPVLTGNLYKKTEKYGILKFIFKPLIFLFGIPIKLRWMLKFFNFPLEFYTLKGIKWILRRYSK